MLHHLRALVAGAALALLVACGGGEFSATTGAAGKAGCRRPHCAGATALNPTP
jgi:hypothetical protein